MAEPPPPETPTAATRAYILGLALACAFRTIDEWKAWGESTLFFALGMSLTVVDYKLPWFLSKAGPAAARKLNAVASDPRWWIGTILAIFLSFGLSPLIDRLVSPPTYPVIADNQPDARDATIAGLKSQLEATKHELVMLSQKSTSPQPVAARALNDSQKRQMVDAVIPLRSAVRTVMINRSNYTKLRLWYDFVEIFARAGFGDANVQSGFQEPSNTSEVGVMICTPDVSAPRLVDLFMKQLLRQIGIEATFVPLSEARYQGDITIFVGPDPL